ncbi:unnamed protein product [Symbiodinium microadriaticum]|nr:unnamed protein product [Symbiodinium microadriaticum]
MKKEEERDKKFDVMWTELYVVCKGLAALEDRKVDDAPDSSLAATAALHRCLLATRCARIAELLTAFACWENGLSLECQDAADGLAVGGVVCLDDEAAGECPVVAANPSTDSFNSTKVRPVLSADEKQRLMTALPKATGKVVKNLWSLVAAGRQSVWDFLDFLETCSSTGQLQLVCHKPDKKKEKAIAFAMKQKLMDRLRPCATAASALPLVLAMSVQQCSGSVLEISDDHLVTTYMEALAHIMAYLQQHLTMVDYMRVDRLKRFALGEELEVAELEDGEVQEDISEAAALEAAKSVVLKSNK